MDHFSPGTSALLRSTERDQLYRFLSSTPIWINKDSCIINHRAHFQCCCSSSWSHSCRLKLHNELRWSPHYLAPMSVQASCVHLKRCHTSESTPSRALLIKGRITVKALRCPSLASSAAHLMTVILASCLHRRAQLSPGCTFWQMIHCHVEEAVGSLCDC